MTVRIAFLLAVLLGTDASAQTQRVMILGDSWAWRREASLNQVILRDHGHSNARTVAPPRILFASRMSEPDRLQDIADWLATYPDTAVIHLSIGANDLNVTPETAGTPHEAEVIAEILENVDIVVDHIWSLRPGLPIFWSSYDYFRPRPNFGSPAEMNDIFLTFNAACAEFARSKDPLLTYDDAYGTLQVAFGFDGVQYTPFDPSFPIPPGDPSLPDPQWPGPYAAYPLGDPDHPNDAGWTALAEAQYQSFYRAFFGGAQFTINAGMNDAWFNPDTPGQGFFFNVFPDLGLVFLAWFTYDTQRPPAEVMAELGEPGHRWLTALGGFDGDTATLEFELTEGGIFDEVPPEVVQTQGYGSITVEFESCTNATVTYAVPAAGVSGEIPVQRIVTDNVALCEALASQ